MVNLNFIYILVDSNMVLIGEKKKEVGKCFFFVYLGRGKGVIVFIVLFLL